MKISPKKIKIISLLFAGIWIGVIAYIAIRIDTSIGIVLGALYIAIQATAYILKTGENKHDKRIKTNVHHINEIHKIQEKIDKRLAIVELDIEELQATNKPDLEPDSLNGDLWEGLEALNKEIETKEDGLYYNGKKITLDPITKEEISFETALQVFNDTLGEHTPIRQNYIANLSQCYIDSYNEAKQGKNYLNQTDVHKLSTKAAENFLKVLAE